MRPSSIAVLTFVVTCAVPMAQPAYGASDAAAEAVPESESPPASEPAPPPPSPPPAAAPSSKALNPDISAIGDFVAAAGKVAADGRPAFELHEAEVGLQSIVDPYARADFFLTFSNDQVGVEEGYLTFTSLPGGLLVKAGKLRDAFGKIDALHTHVVPTADRPIVSTNLLGGEDALADAGISVARLIPIPGVFLEATGQVFRGESQVFKAPARGDLAYVGHLRFYRDLSESSNLDLGGSIAFGHNGARAGSTTRLIGADATFRYKPLRRAIYRHLLARAELVWSRRELSDGPVQNAFGGYGYLEYQLSRRLSAGARYDNSQRAEAASLRDRGGSLILSFWPSEFSQVRGQYRYTRLAEGRTANEFLFQLLFAIGAHGAHPF